MVLELVSCRLHQPKLSPNSVFPSFFFLIGKKKNIWKMEIEYKYSHLESHILLFFSSFHFLHIMFQFCSHKNNIHMFL